jgi:predicted Zn-dependent peptidase
MKRVSATFGLLLGALLAGSPAPAQERTAPETPARPRVPIYDPGLRPERRVLKNGVVLVVQEQRTSDRVAASVALRMGTLYEDDGVSGLSQVLMQALPKGTAKLNPIELQLRLLAHKVSIESGAGPDHGQVAIETFRESVTPALDLLAEIVLTPSFPDTSVEAARSAFMAKAADDVEGPIPATYTMFLSALYRGSPFARPVHGTVQAISECRRSDIVALHKRFFVGGNMAVAVVGNVDAKKVLAQLEKLFAAVPAGPAAEPAGGDPVPLGADTLLSAERPFMARSLVYGYPAPGYSDPDYPAFMIIDSYLRSGDRSPLVFWLPQRNQAAAVGVVYPAYPRRSSIAVHLAALPKKYQAARDSVASVMARLREQPLDEGEWGEQLKRVQNGFFFRQNEPLVRVRNYSRWEVQGVTLEYPRQFEAALLKLKPEDVRDAAARWFTHAAEATLMPPAQDAGP